ncbi:hypothetical protein DXG01_000787 [Tephrocybe rancida]|nr:hypothetical protein DXG01_000787 [Tephrocybe rancida]
MIRFPLSRQGTPTPANTTHARIPYQCHHPTPGRSPLFHRPRPAPARLSSFRFNRVPPPCAKAFDVRIGVSWRGLDGYIWPKICFQNSDAYRRLNLTQAHPTDVYLINVNIIQLPYWRRRIEGLSYRGSASNGYPEYTDLHTYQSWYLPNAHFADPKTSNHQSSIALSVTCIPDLVKVPSGAIVI